MIVNLEDRKCAYEAVGLLVKDEALKRFLQMELIRAGEASAFVTEREVIEINTGFITISISWSYVTIVDVTSHDYVDCTSKEEQVKNFLYKYFKEH